MQHMLLPMPQAPVLLLTHRLPLLLLYQLHPAPLHLLLLPLLALCRLWLLLPHSYRQQLLQ
jgi:hypothetical protein